MGLTRSITALNKKNIGSGLAIRAVFVYITLMEKICSINGCCSKVYRREYCTKHYMRFKRHGNPEIMTRKSPGTATHEDKKRQKREEYLRNKEKYIARAAKWAKNNPEKTKAIRESEENRKKARERTRAWVGENKERKREIDKQWVSKNRSLSRSYKAKRRARQRNATPKWLTKEQANAIAKIYAEAERLTRETGIPHQVDHIVPLSGKTVSGLHVPWNLRAIPAVENNRRPRIWDHNTQI